MQKLGSVRRESLLLDGTVLTPVGFASQQSQNNINGSDLAVENYDQEDSSWRGFMRSLNYEERERDRRTVSSVLAPCMS